MLRSYMGDIQTLANIFAQCRAELSDSPPSKLRYEKEWPCCMPPELVQPTMSFALNSAIVLSPMSFLKSLHKSSALPVTHTIRMAQPREVSGSYGLWPVITALPQPDSRHYGINIGVPEEGSPHLLEQGLLRVSLALSRRLKPKHQAMPEFCLLTVLGTSSQSQWIVNKLMLSKKRNR